MYDVLIIGGGITGAAAAFQLSKYKLNIAVLERENDVAMGATKANSAILHAGYDPKPGTLMARLNVRGVELAKGLCQRLDVPYRSCGSFVLALSEEDRAKVEELYRRGWKTAFPGCSSSPGRRPEAWSPTWPLRRSAPFTPLRRLSAPPGNFAWPSWKRRCATGRSSI